MFSIDSDHFQPSKSKTCHICNERFPHIQTLHFHLRIIHKIQPECDHCGYASITRNQMETHMWTHFPNESMKNTVFQCVRCNQSFSTHSEWTKHTRSYMKCDICDIKFTKMRSGDIHRNVRNYEVLFYCVKLITFFAGKAQWT